MSEKRYDVQVICLLLDKYERSAVYSGTAKRKQSVSVTITSHAFPDYFDLTSTAYERMNEQMENLASMHLVTLIWKDRKQDGILSKVQLNLDPESLTQSYRFAGRKTRREKEREIGNVLQDYRHAFPEFTAWAEERIRKQESVKQYIDIDHPEALRRTLYLAQKIRDNRNDIFLRQFSIQVFHDSKIAEHEIGSAAAILTHFQGIAAQKAADSARHTDKDGTIKTGRNHRGGDDTAGTARSDTGEDGNAETVRENTDRDLTGLSTDEVLEEYNIYRNPSWVMLKGCGAPLGLPMGIGISNEDIDRIPWKRSSSPARILTIENLTSFHQWKTKEGGDDLVIYLGGYANRARRDMLKRLHAIYPDAAFAHFGDIDAGGFRIWKHLCLSTGLSIETFLMDETTYLRYLKYGRDLTIHDRTALRQMSEDPFFRRQRELFACMLKQGKKLEQECIETDWGKDQEWPQAAPDF